MAETITLRIVSSTLAVDEFISILEVRAIDN